MYSYIVDFIIVVIAIIAVFDGFKKGFVRSFILLVGYILAIVISMKLGEYLSDFIFNKFIYQNIVDDINKALPKEMLALNASEFTQTAIDAVPTFVTTMLLLNFGGFDGVTKTLETPGNINATSISESIVNSIVAPTITPFLQAIICFISFFILIFFVKFLAGIFRNFDSVPILGSVNTILGGVVGVVQAIVIVFLLAFVSSLIISITSNELAYLNQTVIERTFIFKLFYAKFI